MWWQLVGECRSTVEVVESEAGSCKEGHKVGFVQVLLKETVFVASS